MEGLLASIAGNELFFVYSLVAIVILLIIVIVVIDKRDNKKKPTNLFDTLNMKIIANPDDIKQEINNEENEIIEIKSVSKEDDFKDLEPIPNIEVMDYKESLRESIKSIEEDIYIEDELEKTQAQIRVEEITKALEEAELKEVNEKDKYEQFEEEQEKNAIISYNELMASFDKLYSENEKIQYLEDDEIPINIEELYKLQQQEKEVTNKKVELEDFSTLKEVKPEPAPTVTSTSTFKSSPYISPVYGIQKPPIQVKKEKDIEIESANQFLQTLKELKSNLDN